MLIKYASKVLELAGAVNYRIFQGKSNSCRVIADKSKGVFFGYYDVTPFSADSSNLLLNMYEGNHFKTPSNADFLEIGYCELHETEQTPVILDKTNTWCWQQGCRLQWYPSPNAKSVIYNKLVKGGYRSVIREIEPNKEINVIDLPVYAVSNSGGYALSLNFSRLQRLRPGYGYSALPDSTLNEMAPKDDGVWLIDIPHNRCKLIVDFERIVNLRSSHDWKNAVHYINHLIFSPDDKHFIFFHLWQNEAGRKNRVLLYKMDSGELSVLDDDCIAASHYTFKNNDELLLTMKDRKHGFVYKLYNISTGQSRILSSQYLLRDSHPSFLKENTILVDNYPDKFRFSELYVYNIDNDKVMKQFSSFHPLKFSGEFRCDLHPRLNREKNIACVDTVKNGRRVMCIIPVLY